MVAYSTEQQRREDGNRGIGPVLIGIILGFCFIASVKAQPYVGAGIGFGTSKNGGASTSANLVNSWTKPNASAFSVYGGYRKEWIGGEVGLIQLPKYRAHAEATSPNRAIDQTIDARSFYGRVNLYGPDFGFTPYGFAGVARTAAKSREWGIRSGSPVEFDCDVKGYSGLYGAGIQYGMFRAEFLHIPHAYKSHWTGDRSYSVVTVSILKEFM